MKVYQLVEALMERDQREEVTVLVDGEVVSVAFISNEPNDEGTILVLEE